VWPNIQACYKLQAAAVWMTETFHTVVSRYPANLASRQKYTWDELWRENEVRL